MEWIRVEDRLPTKESQRVFVSGKHKKDYFFIAKALFQLAKSLRTKDPRKIWFLPYTRQTHADYITHWMPFPEPAEEEKQEKIK